MLCSSIYIGLFFCFVFLLSFEGEQNSGLHTWSRFPTWVTGKITPAPVACLPCMSPLSGCLPYLAMAVMSCKQIYTRRSLVQILLAVSKHFSYLRWKCASSLFTCRRGCRHRGVTNQKLNGYIWDLCCSHPTFKLFRQFCRLSHFFPPPCLASPSDDLITRLARKGEKCAWDNRNLSPIRMIRDRCKKIFKSGYLECTLLFSQLPTIDFISVCARAFVFGCDPVLLTWSLISLIFCLHTRRQARHRWRW